MRTHDPVLVAPDAFKGTLSAPEVANAIARGLRAGGWPAVDLCPVADGGEGTAEALRLALGGETQLARVHDPLGREIEASFVLLDGGRSGLAVVEAAAASGIALLSESERDPFAASTRGTGELIVAAARAGASEVLVAAGGSATSDGGAGALAAIRDAGGLEPGTSVVVLCDVRTPWERAAEVFGPQKGADPATVRRLSRRLDRLAARMARDPRGLPLTGAAGGLSGGLWAELGARLEPGAAFVLGALDFDARMRAAHAVVLGEGRLDESTMEGKLVWEAATRCRQAGVPCFAVVGERRLDAFAARMLDLQMVLEGSSPEQLELAAARLVSAF